MRTNTRNLATRVPASVVMLLAPVFLAVLALEIALAPMHALAGSVEDDLQRIGATRGVVAVLGLSDNESTYPVRLASASELTLYVQVAEPDRAVAAREAASQAGLLGSRIFIAEAPPRTILLADNVADAVLVGSTFADQVPDAELLRVLRPRGTAHVGERQLVKPVPSGIDEWTHPYHGPDNNPQSQDQLVRGDLNTQFIGYPKFSPMPEQSVVAGGRIFKAMGHIAHKANQNEMLNTLLCINAYNGTILWKRPLPEGFMIHRNTMVATDDTLYLGDHESCKMIDAQTGKVLDELKISPEISDGPVWKWMAIREGVLYALVGNPEIQVDTQKSDRRGLGHWPWGMWKGHDYNDPRTAFGYGRTLVAFDLKSKRLLWHYRDQEFLDARAVCMNDNFIYCFCPEKFLACVDLNDGKLAWRNTDKKMLDGIGPNGKAQHYVTGYATTCYMKCSNEYLFFSGPQRERLAVVSARDGNLAWTFPVGNLQLVLRNDAIWAAGPQQTKGVRLDYSSGKVLAEFPARRACTRATGCLDSIFYRASGGTVRVRTEDNMAQHIAPMRPPCQDGVIVSNGHLYWGPWMCGCQLSLYGNIALAPAGDRRSRNADPYADALVSAQNPPQVEPLEVRPGDWPSYRGDNARSDTALQSIPDDVQLRWETQLTGSSALLTAPVAAGGMVFVADRSGQVQALDAQGRKVWKAFTGGPIYYPPTVANDRVYVGSADGRVYAYAARSGDFLWSFRVAPEDRWIPVFDKLVSTWPVAGGVVVDQGTVYAAAGIAHYDGTFVVALDAVTGRLRAQNTSSGSLAPEVDGGISVQGNLTIVDGELRFLGGGVYETARYDLKTLKCLNEPKVQVTSEFRTAFYPFYPEYGKYLSLEYTCPDGCTLSHDASYEGSVFTNLSLQDPLPPGVNLPRKEAARWIQRRGGTPPKTRWQDKSDRRFTGFIVTPQRLLASAHPDADPSDNFLVATNIKDGGDVWRVSLPAQAVTGGLAMDHESRIYVSLENGKLMCLAPKKK
jgi:outer membrane protein assembly factor BamB